MHHLVVNYLKQSERAIDQAAREFTKIHAFHSRTEAYFLLKDQLVAGRECIRRLLAEFQANPNVIDLED